MKDIGKKTVHQYVSEGPEIEIGRFIIRKLKDGSLWIEKNNGEGMSCEPKALEPLLHQFFKENF